MKSLLRLQELDLRIEACKLREAEIPKQEEKLEIYRKRLLAELEEREAARKALLLEQRDCERDIEQKQAQINKYDQQLYAIKKNEEYQALLHEMDMLKKQVGVKEERVLAIMLELDDAEARLKEDRARIQGEIKEVDQQCAEVDKELSEVQAERAQLEGRRAPLVDEVDPDLRSRYDRIRKSKKTGPAVVPLRGQFCTGCNMAIPPQIANEVLAGEKIHSCNHCGRLLYEAGNFEGSAENVPERVI